MISPRSRVALGLAALAGALSLALAGCGADSPASDYVSEADAICARADARLDTLAGPESAEDALLALDETAPILRQRRDQLGRLTPPDLARADHDLGMRALDDQLSVIADAAQRRLAGEPVTGLFAEVRSRLSDIEPRIQSWRRGAELRVCGQQPVLALAVRPPGQLLPPAFPDRPPLGSGDESPARAAFRRTFEGSCALELDRAVCACAVERIGAAYPDDGRFFGFARGLEAGEPAVRAEAEMYVAECLRAG